MKIFFKNILVYTLATFVIFISVGFNISKVSCDQNISIYFGKIEYKCLSQISNVKTTLDKEVSCCSILEESTCCSSFNCICEKEFSNIHFNFETLLIEKNNFNVFSFLLFEFLKVESFIPYINFLSFSSEAPLIIYQPILSKIQSFII